MATAQPLPNSATAAEFSQPQQRTTGFGCARWVGSNGRWLCVASQPAKSRPSWGG